MSGQTKTFRIRIEEEQEGKKR